MIARRFVARLIDIGLPLFASALAYYVIAGDAIKGLISEEIGITFPILFLFFYLLTTLTPLFTRKEGRTLGDAFLKIAPIEAKTGNFPGTKKIVYKELFLSFLLCGALLFPNGWIAFLLAHLPIGRTEEEGNIRIILDLLFKLDAKHIF